MRKWERGGVCLHAPTLFPPPFPPSRRGGGGGAAAAPTVCNMPQAENHPINWAEGRTLHAAKQTALKYTRLTVERHYTRLPERLGAGKSKTRAACHGGGAKKAVAAMTCPGVPTHRKRLRPAERVETESANTGANVPRLARRSPKPPGWVRFPTVPATCRVAPG